MPEYRYKAVKLSGEIVKGSYTGKSKQEIINMIRQSKMIPVIVDEIDTSRDIEINNIFNPISRKDIAVFCRQFYTMLNAGLSIVNCLDILRQQTQSNRLKKVADDLCEQVQKGMVFSDALKSHKAIFTELFISMVEVGEASGNLDIIMDRLAIHFEKENNIRQKLQNAMIYPVILCIVSMLIVSFLLVFVIPTFLDMFQANGIPVPLSTRILLFISNIIKSYWNIIIPGIIICFYILFRFSQSNKGKLFVDRVSLRIPIIKNNTQKIVTSRFTRTLSTLLYSGIPLLDSIDIVTRVVGNKVVANALIKAGEEVKKGISLALAIKNTKIFPPMVNSMIKIGEESGSLAPILEKTAIFYDRESETALNRMMALFEPMMIIIMAIIIGFIVISMILPMFEMINTVEF